MRYLLIFLFIAGCGMSQAEDEDFSHFYYDGVEYSDLVIDGLRYLGYSEQRNRRELTVLLGVDPVKTEWCAAFMNYLLRKNGYSTSEDIHDYPLLARSFTEYGTRVTGEPRSGDIVVLTRGTQGWQGHVGFYLGTVKRDGRTYYALLSGNDDNRVTIDLYHVGRVVAVRRPEQLVLLQGVEPRLQPL